MPTKSIVTEKRCPRCRQTKPVSDWNKSKNRYDGLSNYCKRCLEERRVIYMAKPGAKEARQAYSQRRYQNNRELAKKRYYARRDKILAIQLTYRQSDKGKMKRSTYNKAAYANPERLRAMRDKRFRKKFGISIEEYDSIFTAQSGKCAICRRAQKRWLSIDHSHVDGKVRGLLCARCNFALGYLNDSPEIADRAGAYLRRHAQLRLVV